MPCLFELFHYYNNIIVVDMCRSWKKKLSNFKCLNVNGFIIGPCLAKGRMLCLDSL